MKFMKIFLICLALLFTSAANVQAAIVTETNGDMTITVECPDSVSSGEEFTVKIWVVDTNPVMYFSNSCPRIFAGGVKFDTSVNGNADYISPKGYSWPDDPWYSCDVANRICYYQNTYIGENKRSCDTRQRHKTWSFTYDYDLTSLGKLYSVWRSPVTAPWINPANDFDPVDDRFELYFKAYDFKLGGRSRLGGSVAASCTVSIGQSIPVPQDIADYVFDLPDTCFDKKPSNKKNTFQNKLEEVQNLIDAGDYQGAVNKLRHDIRPKLDGADQDWITCGDGQENPTTMIDTLIAYLESLM